MHQRPNTDPGRRLTRRQALKLGGAISAGVMGTGALATAPGRTAVQFDSTPPPPPELTLSPPADPIADLAARLDYDQDAIFAFVRDEIHYETYTGVLRGAKGTLWARAGNSADQAVLLAALLEASQIPHRFAVGPLNDTAEADLASQLTPARAMANVAYGKALVAASNEVFGQQGVENTPEALSEAEQAAIEDVTFQARAAIESAALASTETLSLLGDALAAAEVELPPLPAASLADRERHSHCWVQVADGPTWINLDPVVTETDPDVIAADTFDAVPDDWHHHLSFRVSADELSGSSLRRRDVVTLTTTSQRVVDVPIAINLAPAEAIEGLGDSINQLLGGQKTILPSIFADGVSVDATQPMLFGTNGEHAGGVFDLGPPAPGAADGESVAVWLIVDITSPDAVPVTVERAIVDRVPPVDRASGVIDPETIAPITVKPSAFDGDELDTVAEFNRFLALYVDVARIPGAYALARSETDQLMGSIHTFGPSLASNRDGLGIEHETRAGVWSYPSAPNITAFSFLAAEEDEEGQIAVDLIYRQRTVHALDDERVSYAPHPLVLSGVLNAVAERMLLSPELRDQAVTPTSPAVSIIDIFEAAQADGVAIRTLTSVDDLTSLAVDDAARVRIEQTLTLGSIVLVPEQPVNLGNTSVSGWWIVDPSTGRTFDLLEDGTGGASVGSGGIGAVVRAGDTLAWYVRWADWITRNRTVINCISNLTGLVATQAAMLLAASHGAGWAAGIGELGSLGQAGRALVACAP